MELYKEYLEEACGLSLKDTKDYFYTYKINEKDVYLQDVYIKKESRNKGLIDDIFSQVYEIAKKEGKGLVTTSVCKNIKEDNKNRSSHIVNKRGYIEYESDEYMIYYYKEII